MKTNKIFRLFLLFALFNAPCIYGQGLPPVAKRVADIRGFAKQANVPLLSLQPVADEPDISETVNNYSLLEYNSPNAREILASPPDLLILNIPAIHGLIQLELVRASIFTGDFSVIEASSGKPVEYHGGVHYQGIIRNNNNSIAAISIFENEIMGLVSSADGNYVLGRLEGNFSAKHIFYKESDLKIKNPIDCHTSDNEEGSTVNDLTQPQSLSFVNCIRVYLEVDYSIFQNKGSVTNATNYVTGLFNQSAMLYANDNIPVSISQIYVWNVVDPYNATLPPTILNQFKAYRTSFAGDIAHLLGTIGNGGIAAGFNGLCNPDPKESMCYSDINMTYNNVPVYSWSVEVVTHEQGHLFGSRHTHACVWNGNNTAIDGCGPAAGYPYEGPCSGAPLPSAGGTIMSYCHLISSMGIIFNNGFGIQPATVIQNRYNAAGCLTACSGSACAAPDNLTTVSVTNTSATLSWDTVPGAIRYIIEYRQSGTTTWQTDSTVTPPIVLSNLLPGELYEWTVQAVCSAGNSVSTAQELFTTAPLTCAIPANLDTPVVSSNFAILSWDFVQGAAGYLVTYRPVGSPNWNSDTVTGVTYQASPLLNNTQYEFQVLTLCHGGSFSPFSLPVFFTTRQSGVIILKPDARCGKDAFVWNAPPFTHEIQNFGEIPFLLIHSWTNSGIADTSRTLIQFDLSTIPVGSTIQYAKLSLFNDSTAYSSNGQHQSLNGSNASYIRRIIEPWNETKVTWKNQPATTTVNQVARAAASNPHEDFLNMDVTQLVIDMIGDPDHSFGFMISLQNEQYYNDLIFASSDNLNPAKFPQLEINYTPPPGKQCYRIRNDAGCGGDTYIWSALVNSNNATNYDGNSTLTAFCWTNSGVPDTIRSLLDFDLSMITPGTTISDARLSLFNDPVSLANNGQHSTQSGSNEVLITGITSPWTPHLVTWTDTVSYVMTNSALIPASTSVHQDFPFLDVTALTQDMINNPSGYHGFLLRLQTEAYYRAMVLASSDHPDGARHPLLDICLTGLVDIDESLRSFTLTAYPNPADEKIFLRGVVSGEIEIIITDMLGKNVYSASRTMNNGVIEIPIMDLANGIYLLKAAHGDDHSNCKFIVSH